MDHGLGERLLANERRRKSAPPRPNREKHNREWVYSGARRERECLEGRTCHESQFQPTLIPVPPIEALHPPFPSQRGPTPLQTALLSRPRACPHCQAQWRRPGRSRQNGTRYACFVHYLPQFRIPQPIHVSTRRTIRALCTCLYMPENVSVKLSPVAACCVREPHILHMPLIATSLLGVHSG